MPLYHLKIKNGTSQLACAVKYYGYTLRDNKYTSSIFGRTYKQENEEEYEEGINYVLNYGDNNITYKNNLIRITITKTGLVCDEYAHNQVFPTEVDIYLVKVDPELKKDENIEESLKTKANTSKSISPEESNNKGGIFQFLQANLLSDTSN